MINKPFALIIECLDNDVVSPIKPLLQEKNEFGKIAKLIEVFFQQKIMLQEEIEERKAITAQIADKNKKLQQIRSESFWLHQPEQFL